MAMAASVLPSVGNATSHYRDQTQKWPPNPYRITGLKMGNGYITPTFSGVLNAQRRGRNQK